MRSGGGTTPVCVGRATKGFGQECFTHHKLHKCNEALADCGRGSLVILFFEAPSGRRVPARNINLLENFLMQSAPSVNDRLLDIRKTGQERWRIRGVVRSQRRGARSKAARQAAAMPGL